MRAVVFFSGIAAQPFAFMNIANAAVDCTLRIASLFGVVALREHVLLMIVNCMTCVVMLLSLMFANVRAVAPCTFLIIMLQACHCHFNVMILNVCASRAFLFVAFCSCTARNCVRVFFFAVRLQIGMRVLISFRCCWFLLVSFWCVTNTFFSKACGDLIRSHGLVVVNCLLVREYSFLICIVFRLPPDHLELACASFRSPRGARSLVFMNRTPSFVLRFFC